MPEIRKVLSLQVPDETTVHRVEQMVRNCQAHWELFAAKNSQRGDSIRLGGLAGAIYEMTGIMGRLFKLVLEEQFDPNDLEQVKDLLNSLEDMHNYTVIAEMMYQDGNYRGKWF